MTTAKLEVSPLLMQALSPNHVLNKSFLIYRKRLDLLSVLNSEYYSAITNISFGWLIIHNNRYLLK